MGICFPKAFFVLFNCKEVVGLRNIIDLFEIRVNQLPVPASGKFCIVPYVYPKPFSVELH